MSDDGEISREIIEPVVEIVTRRDKTRGKKIGETALDYVPSTTEQMLLDVLLDPYHRMASVSRQCELAGVSRMAYYRAFQNMAFVDYYRTLLTDMIKAQGGQLINIGIREARKGSFPHWKVLMEMGGFYNGDKKDVNVDADVQISVRFVDPDDDSDH